MLVGYLRCALLILADNGIAAELNCHAEPLRLPAAQAGNTGVRFFGCRRVHSVAGWTTREWRF
jgi:hypothetical protein